MVKREKQALRKAKLRRAVCRGDDTTLKRKVLFRLHGDPAGTTRLGQILKIDNTELAPTTEEL